ncbi:hypothetical protein NL676_009486 [Syzygium grande]|nr:hypothetical protein NL676_009486 [Syzygium grande]
MKNLGDMRPTLATRGIVNDVSFRDSALGKTTVAQAAMLGEAIQARKKGNKILDSCGTRIKHRIARPKLRARTNSENSTDSGWPVKSGEKRGHATGPEAGARVTASNRSNLLFETTPALEIWPVH